MKAPIPRVITHIASGNQECYSTLPSGGLTAELIQLQKALMDELLKVTTGQTGVQTLKRSKALLDRRLPQISGHGQ